ncbi:MAG TPA: M15 family metallopeptidase [Candidatus Angelobacter sp.]|nr:M15 family metallopeptidase [Candidatus Angelobacter sp.]
MDALCEERLSQVFPQLAERIRRMAIVLEAEGVLIRVVQSLRTWAEQDALYLKGRDAQGKIVDLAAVVTNCPGGRSYHNFGLAVDCVPSTHGAGCPFDPDWNSKHEVWQKMISAGIRVGLSSGATWRTFHDFPHFQLTGRFPEGAPSEEIHELYRRGGLRAVWDEVGRCILVETQSAQNGSR